MAKIQKVSDDFKGISTTNFRIFSIFWGDFSGFFGFLRILLGNCEGILLRVKGFLGFLIFRIF